MGAENPKGEDDFDGVSLVMWRTRDVLRKRGPEHDSVSVSHPLEPTGMPSLNTTVGPQTVLVD